MASFKDLIPLIVLLVVVAGGGYIGYQIYLWSNQLSDRGKKHMEKKNMTFTKDGGLKVGVKEVKDEEYTDKTQSVLVDVWNKASFPANDKKKSGSGNSAPARTTSSQQKPASSSHTTSSASSLAAPAPRGSSQRSSSPVPGGWS